MGAAGRHARSSDARPAGTRAQSGRGVVSQFESNSSPPIAESDDDETTGDEAEGS